MIGKGDYDIFAWGWTPFVDPDQMLSYFTCDQVADDPENPTNYYNDANWCDREYDRLYEAAEGRARPGASASTSCTRCCCASTTRRSTTCSTSTPTRRPTAKGRFTGFVKQPAKTGPVIYSNSSPTYARLKPVSATAAAGGGDDGGGGSGGLIAIAVVAVALVGGAVLLDEPRRTADERE